MKAGAPKTARQAAERVYSAAAIAGPVKRAIARSGVGRKDAAQALQWSLQKYDQIMRNHYYWTLPIISDLCFAHRLSLYYVLCDFYEFSPQYTETNYHKMFNLGDKMADYLEHDAHGQDMARDWSDHCASLGFYRRKPNATP